MLEHGSIRVRQREFLLQRFDVDAFDVRRQPDLPAHEEIAPERPQPADEFDLDGDEPDDPNDPCDGTTGSTSAFSSASSISAIRGRAPE